MQNQNNKIHETLAHEIKSAKKTLFKRHREGVPLRAALDQFSVDICNRFEKIEPPIGQHDSVTATLEDVQQVNPSDFSKVLEALHELLHNPATPQDLFEAVAEFTCEQTNKAGADKIGHMPVVLSAVLASVDPSDLRGAVVARVEAEFGGNKGVTA